ncbi:MAG: efflux transporter outer membrane subunit [Verrucomicrobia bacterium]|nr:efflux transporter outer membrane subunit [Verrucomicrobiota bacterium]
MSKDQQREHLLAPLSLEASREEGLGSGYLDSGNWPEEAWWKIFKDEQLDRLIERALAQNPTIQAIGQRVELARQETIVAKSELYPWLSFDYDEIWELLSRNGLYKQFNPQLPISANLIDMLLSFNYEFDFWSKYRNLYRAALGRERAEEAEKAQVKLIVTTTLATAFYNLKANVWKRNLYRQLAEVRKNYFDLQTLLNREALLSKLPPLWAQENWEEAAKKLANAEEQVKTAEHLVNILAGTGPDEPLAIDEMFSPLEKSAALPENLSVDLLARRPDLMAQIWRVESLAHDVGAARADFFPDINLVGMAGSESVLYRKLFKWDSKTWGLKPSIHLPIFTAGEIRANINAKIAAFEQAVFEYNQLLLKSASEVADTVVLIQSIFKQKESQRVIVENAAARYELTLLREKMGLDSRFDHLSYRDALILKQIDNADLQFGQYLSTIQLIRSLGGGYLSEFVPLRKGGE